MRKLMSGAAKSNTRSWRHLRAALAYLMTRDEAFAEEVELDEGANQNIELDLQIRRAMGQETSEGPSTAHAAWLLLRGYVSDGKVKARGIAIDRRGNGPSFVETKHSPAPLPPYEAEHSVLCDGAEDETWLSCEEGPFGQGRYWRSVTVSWTDLMKCFPLVGDAVTEASEHDPARKKSGRKPAYPWPQCREAVMSKLHEDGAPTPDCDEVDWRSQADLERFIASWMVNRLGEKAEQPVTSTVRMHASSWLDEFAASKADNLSA